MRRTRGAAGAKVKFTDSMPFRSKKDLFLANAENKQNFLNMLSEKLEENSCRTIHATGDADVLIAQTAIESARDKVTVLIGENTDLLVLLLFHADLEAKNIFFQSVQSGTKKMKAWDITKTKHLLGPNTCYLLPFVHAITGCDTTSRMFGIGKGASLKKVRSDAHFQELASVFCRTSSQEDVVAAGEGAIVVLYNGDRADNLDTLRYKKFSTKVTMSTTCVQVHTLPPTSDAAAYHSKRVYLQVQQWVKPEANLSEEEWGGASTRTDLYL